MTPATYTVNDVIVKSVSPTTVSPGIATTLTFVTEGLRSYPYTWIKIIPASATSCATTQGTTDAIVNGAGRLTYVSSTSGTFDLTTTASAAGDYIVCYGLTSEGVCFYKRMSEEMCSPRVVVWGSAHI